MRSCAIIASLSMLALGPPGRAQTTYPCEAAPGVKQALEAVTAPVDDISNEERLERQRTGFQNLLSQYPDDFFVRRAHARFLRGERGRDPGIADYRRLLDQHPDDPRYMFYYALTLIGQKTPEAIEQLNKAVEKAPEFAWPHLALGEIHQYPNFRDREKHRRQIETFVRLCPESLEPYSFISRMDKSPFVEESAKRLRSLLERRSLDREVIGAYGSLWTLEFKAVPISEHPAVRKRVEADIGRIKSSDLVAKHRYLSYTLASGYKLIGQAEEAKKLEESAQPEHYRAWQAWDKEHPSPKPGDSPEKATAYRRELLKATAEWIAKWPNETMPYLRRLGAMDSLDDVPTAEVEATCDALLARKNPNDYSVPPAPIRVAQTFVKKGVRLDRVPEMVRASLEQFEKRPVSPQNDLYPRDNEDYAKTNLEQTRWSAWSVLAEAAIKSGKPDEAKEPLARMEEALAKTKPAESANDWDKRRYQDNQRTYWERKAQLAAAEKRSLDALAYYEKAIGNLPPRDDRWVKESREKLTASAHDLWKQLGGTDEGWQAWLNRERPKSAVAPPGGPQWTKMDKPLPKFEVSDIQGKTWTLAALKGKTTLINVWASW